MVLGGWKGKNQKIDLNLKKSDLNQINLMFLIFFFLIKKIANPAFMRPDSTVRCKIDTTALALGVDIPEVKYIIN